MAKTTRTALVSLGKLIASGMPAGLASLAFDDVGAALAANPTAIAVILDLMAKEAAKKKSDADLVAAFGIMLERALTALRFAAESGHAEAVAAIADLRAQVLDLARNGKATPDLLAQILHQFTSAGLDMGDDLREAMAARIEADPRMDRLSADELHQGLVEILRECGDIFVFQGRMAEQNAMLPDSQRANLVVLLLNAPDPLLREAVPGWLLDRGTQTRRATAELLQQAATVGQVSGTMLRRMIAMRNWLPDDERPSLDAIIRTCRLNGIDCAPMPAATVRDMLTTAVDGAGAQSLFAVVKDGRKQAITAILYKRGAGIRDAWVDAGLSKADAETFVFQVETSTECFDSDLDFARLALEHALADGLTHNTLPPFGAVAVAERLGLAELNPRPLSLDDVLTRLWRDLPADPTAAQIATVLTGTATWERDFAFLESWFEDSAAVDAVLQPKRLSAKRRLSLVLDDILAPRRAHWAGMLAWTAMMLRHAATAQEVWPLFAIVAREIAGGRPLADIPLMSAIARKTVEAWKYRNTPA